MNNEQAYNQWSGSYDSVANKTRDLEAKAFRNIVGALSSFADVLEIGCGTGKNTVWLQERTKRLVAADFSAEMMRRAQEKITAAHVQFVQTDIRQSWTFAEGQFELVTTSLVLEHIADIDAVFAKAAAVLKPGGWFYMGEYHPFKQYMGKKARFETGSGEFELESFIHHVSDFTEAGKKAGLFPVAIEEWFDEDDRFTTPRLLTILFRKGTDGKGIPD